MNNKTKIKPYIFFIIPIVFILAYAIISRMIPVTIDLNEYTVLDFKGPSGYAELHEYIDWDKVFEDKGAFIKEKIFTIHLFPDSNAKNTLKTSVWLNADKHSNIKNGDIIHIAYTSGDLDLWGIANVTLECEPKIYEVAGLPEPVYYDPFDSLEVTFSGENGSGSANFNYNGSEEYLESGDFSIDGNGSLSNGDTVTVKFSERVYDVKETGRAASTKEKTIIVEGLK